MRPADPQAVLLTAHAAAVRLSVSRASLYRLIKDGRLTAVRLYVEGEGRGQLMVRASDLQAFVKGLPDVAA
jgi:excisionase family DNA binding protein